MAKRKPFGVYSLLDSEPAVALVRYDGDIDTFTALASTWLADRHAEYENGDYSVEPPRPRLYRFNPTSDPDYSWSLGYPAEPGPGVFVGALLEVGRRWSCAYCLIRYDEGHADDCVKMLRQRSAMASGSSFSEAGRG